MVPGNFRVTGNCTDEQSSKAIDTSLFFFKFLFFNINLFILIGG